MCHFYSLCTLSWLLATHSCRPSHPSTWSTWEARRAGRATWRTGPRGGGDRQGPGGTGPAAARRAQVSVGCELFCTIFADNTQLTPAVPPVVQHGRRDGPGGQHGAQGREEEAVPGRWRRTGTAGSEQRHVGARLRINFAGIDSNCHGRGWSFYPRRSSIRDLCYLFFIILMLKSATHCTDCTSLASCRSKR